MGPSDGLDGCGKSRPTPGFNTRTVQPVARHYNQIYIRNRNVIAKETLTPLTSTPALNAYRYLEWNIRHRLDSKLKAIPNWFPSLKF